MRWIKVIYTAVLILLMGNAVGGFHLELSCPRCGGTNMDALQRRGAVDGVLAMLRVHPYHCRRCYGKFYMLKVANEIVPRSVSGKTAKSRS